MQGYYPIGLRTEECLPFFNTLEHRCLVYEIMMIPTQSGFLYYFRSVMKTGLWQHMRKII